MSKEMKRNLAGGGIGAALLILVVVGLVANPFAARGADVEEIREIVLEARDLAFAGDNPTLHLKPGERVRFVVRNTDPGILHSITLPGIDSEVRHVKYGEEISFEVTVPEGGTFQYTCPQHAPKMQGRIVVEPGGDG